MAGLLQPFFWSILIDCILTTFTGRFLVYSVFFRLTHFLGVAQNDRPRQIIVLAALAAGLRILQELLGMAQRLLSAYIGYNGLIRVRCDLFRKLQQLSLGYHKSQPQGDAIYRLSYDTGGFQTILTVLVNSVLVSAVTLIIMTGIMLRLNWRLTLITLSVAPLLLWTTKLFAGPLKQRWLEAKEVDMRLTTVIQRSVAAIGLVQAFGREADEFNRFQGTVHDSKRVNLRQAVAGIVVLAPGGGDLRSGVRDHSRIWRLAGVSRRSCPPSRRCHDGRQTVDISRLRQSGLCAAAISRRQRGDYSKRCRRRRHRVFEVLDRDPDIKDSPMPPHLPRRPRVLMLSKVSFEYRPGEPVLLDVDATISPGQMVAFVGSSGVGKTTLLSLLPRFYDPTSRLADARRHRHPHGQDQGPPRARGAGASGKPDSPDDGRGEYLLRPAGRAQSQIEELLAWPGPRLSSKNCRRDTRPSSAKAAGISPAASGSASASHGAAYRGSDHGLRRADQCARSASRSDDHANASGSEAAAHTIIVVSHRLSTVMDCDQIFVMDEGRIVESGTHQQLLTLRGVYFGMAQQQLKVETSTAV